MLRFVCSVACFLIAVAGLSAQERFTEITFKDKESKDDLRVYSVTFSKEPARKDREEVRDLLASVLKADGFVAAKVVDQAEDANDKKLYLFSVRYDGKQVQKVPVSFERIRYVAIKSNVNTLLEVTWSDVPDPRRIRAFASSFRLTESNYRQIKIAQVDIKVFLSEKEALKGKPDADEEERAKKEKMRFLMVKNQQGDQ